MAAQKLNDSTGDTLCDKSMRHVPATGCCNKLPHVTWENLCCCDRFCHYNLSHKFILVWIHATHRSSKRRRKQVCRSSSADKATCCGDVSQRFVAVICCIVCFGPNRLRGNLSHADILSKFLMILSLHVLLTTCILELTLLPTRKLPLVEPKGGILVTDPAVYQ